MKNLKRLRERDFPPRELAQLKYDSNLINKVFPEKTNKNAKAAEYDVFFFETIMRDLLDQHVVPI